MQDYRKLKVRREAQSLTVLVYRITEAFPRSELNAMTSQLRRASASIAANIAEGCGRGTRADMARFLLIALGSANETDSHLHLAHELGWINGAIFAESQDSADHIKRMLLRLLGHLRVQSPKPTPRNTRR